jgi:hypothetical protein
LLHRACCIFSSKFDALFWLDAKDLESHTLKLFPDPLRSLLLIKPKLLSLSHGGSFKKYLAKYSSEGGLMRLHTQNLELLRLSV